MKKIDSCKSRRKAGFTLVELIVVLILLSVLSAVAVPTYLGYVDDNKAKQCERNRQTLASYLDNMLVTDPGAGMSDVIAAHSEIKCPSGGEYKVLEGSANNTVYCTCEGHGGTEGAVTVIAKKSSQVTAKSSTETEKKVEPKPEQTEPPVTNSPEEPKPVALSVSISPDSPSDMGIGEDAKPLSAEPISQNCSNINYIWKVESGDAVHIEGAFSSQTVNIKADHAGTSTISCQATATSDVDSTTVISVPATVDVTVNPVVPTLSYSVNPTSVEMEVEGEEKTLSVVNLQSTYCTVNGYNWTSNPEGIVQVAGNGGTATLTPLAEGTCTIHCQAADIVVDSDAGDNRPQDNGVDVQVTVNKKKELSVTVSPKQMSLEPNEKDTLEADVTASGYDSYDCVWTVDQETVASVERTTGDQKKANVTGLSEGTAIVTCTVTTDDGAAIATDTATVTVKPESKKQKLLKNIPDPLLINGNENGINMSQYVETEGGVWSTNSSNIVCSGEINNHWIQAKAAGECEYTYTLKGESESVEARVVYPIRGFYSTTDTTNILTMKIGESNWEFPANPDPGNTTDVSANWVWRHSGEDGIISYSLNPEKTKATVTALSEGYVELEVSARSEYETWKNGSDVWKTLRWKINVIDPNKLTGISVNNMGMKVNDTRQIQVNCNPSGVNREGISFGYSGYGDCISIDANGNIRAEKKGSTTVTVQARKNGVDLEGISCTFNVAVTDLQSIAVEPQNVNVKSGETATAKILYTPEWADISQVSFELGGYDSSKFGITKKQDGILEITGYQACSDQWIEAKAYLSGEQVANCNFNVSVTSTNSGDTAELQGIEVEQKIDSLIVGQKATVTMYPDESGDIVVKPIPLSETVLNSAHFDNYVTSTCINPVTNNGKTSSLTAASAGKATTIIRIYLSGSGTPYQQTISINVIENPNGPIKYYVNGSEVSSTPWSVLKDYIKRKSEDPNVQPSSTFGIFAASSSELYVLKENPQLKWDKSYDNVTFGEYLKLDNNIDQFVKVDTSQIIWAGNPFSGGIGSILGRNDVYYVCVKAVPDNERSNTNNDDFLNQYFARLS